MCRVVTCVDHAIGGAVCFGLWMPDRWIEYQGKRHLRLFSEEDDERITPNVPLRDVAGRSWMAHERAREHAFGHPESNLDRPPPTKIGTRNHLTTKQRVLFKTGHCKTGRLHVRHVV